MGREGKHHRPAIISDCPDFANIDLGRVSGFLPANGDTDRFAPLTNALVADAVDVIFPGGAKLQILEESAAALLKALEE